MITFNSRKMLEALFRPFKIGPVEIRNRIVMPPMITFLASESGAVTQRMIDYYAERARGGNGTPGYSPAPGAEKLW